jgi:glycosyltransferase involved in cell wall biosynthesis
MREVLFTAAHYGFDEREPLGGGASVSNALAREWKKSKPFPFRFIGPRDVGVAPEKPLTQLNEFQYARFCREFERATTNFVRENREKIACVFANDVSEGPNFAELARLGVPFATIFHVDVVDFFARMYLRGAISAKTFAKFAAVSPMLPDVLRLVVEKQRDCVWHAAKLIVMSGTMKQTILECYPFVSPEKVEVVPWGVLDEAMPLPKNGREGEVTLLTLSRISPEKGIERLISALEILESRPLPRKISLKICGAPAFMGGKRYEKMLRKRAARLRNVRVEFVGHVTAQRKRELLAGADLFVSPSRHESYGLTIVEAMRAGCAILSANHGSASEIVRENFGEIVDFSDANAAAAAIFRLISDKNRLRVMGETAGRAAETQKFSIAAAKLAMIAAAMR